MKFPSLSLLFILAVIAGFVVLNWTVFLSPTELSIGYTSVRMPLGMVMLGVLVFVTALFLAFVVYLQGSVLLEARRHSRELTAKRELAERAEASRFTELQAFLEAELSRQSSLNVESKTEVLARIDRLEQEFRSSMEQSGNSLAACIGELEDRVVKLAALPAG